MGCLLLIQIEAIFTFQVPEAVEEFPSKALGQFFLLIVTSGSDANAHGSPR